VVRLVASQCYMTARTEVNDSAQLNTIIYQRANSHKEDMDAFITEGSEESGVNQSAGDNREYL